MSLYELILSRRTIRRFKRDPIPFALLEKMINAGRLAPSGSNLQPCEFIAVDEPELVAEVFAGTKWAGYLPAEEGPPGEPERPTAFIVILLNRERRQSGGEHDAAAAIMNMIYTALEEGIGACWIGSVDRVKVRALLGISERCEIDSVLALGYRAESPRVEESAKNVKYWRDEEGVLHVPKRPLSDILHRNTYKPQNAKDQNANWRTV